MRVLVVCHRFPYPPTRGGKIRPFNIIKHLSANHEVTVASLSRSREETLAGQGIADHCAHHLMEQVDPASAWLRMIARLPSPGPSSMGYFHSPRLARRIRKELSAKPYDLIFVHCSSVAHYVADVRSVPKIMDFGDMDSQKWLAYAQARRLPLSLGYLLEGKKLERAETRLARSFDFCTCTTRAELESLTALDQKTPSGWFPNGVDLDYFAPTGDPYDSTRICFVGRMDYFPNQDAVKFFCAEVLPQLRAQVPGLGLRIVGANPSQEILDLGKSDGVEVTGTVADVRPFVQGSCLTVAPLKIARGTQNKILESLAMGVPVVSSDLAAKGIDAVADDHLLTARDVSGYVSAVLQLVRDPAARQRLAAAGRARMESHHTWSASMRKLDGFIEQVRQRASGQPG